MQAHNYVFEPPIQVRSHLDIVNTILHHCLNSPPRALIGTRPAMSALNICMETNRAGVESSVCSRSSRPAGSLQACAARHHLRWISSRWRH